MKINTDDGFFSLTTVVVHGRPLQFYKRGPCNKTYSMVDEYAYGKDVWFTGMIDKSANVSVILGVDAVQLVDTFL